MQGTSGHVYMNEYACVNPRVGFVTHRTFVPGPSLLPAVPRDRYPMGVQIALKTEQPLAEGSVMT